MIGVPLAAFPGPFSDRSSMDKQAGSLEWTTSYSYSEGHKHVADIINCHVLKLDTVLLLQRLLIHVLD